MGKLWHIPPKFPQKISREYFVKFKFLLSWFLVALCFWKNCLTTNTTDIFSLTAVFTQPFHNGCTVMDVRSHPPLLTHLWPLTLILLYFILSFFGLQDFYRAAPILWVSLTAPRPLHLLLIFPVLSVSWELISPRRSISHNHSPWLIYKLTWSQISPMLPCPQLANPNRWLLRSRFFYVLLPIKRGWSPGQN